MPEEKKQPYIQSKPGDLWTAEIWNDTQVQIKEDIETKVDAKVKALKDEIEQKGVNSQVQIEKDIATKVKALKDEIEQKGVNFAQNADKFAGKTSGEWESGLDRKFAPITHDHKAKSIRLFKRFTKTENSAIIVHDFGGFPMVDICKLKEIEGLSLGRRSGGVKFLLFKEGELDFKEVDFREPTGKSSIAFPLKEVLADYDVNLDRPGNIEGTGFLNTLNSIQTGLWDSLFGRITDDNDSINYALSKWVQEKCTEKVTLRTLIGSGDWDKIYLYFRPAKEEYFSFFIQYLNYHSIVVGIKPEGFKDDEVVDVMLVLRP